MHFFFCEEIGEAGAAASLEREESDHLFKTLRGAPGMRVGLMDGRGGVASAVVEEKRIVRVESRRSAPADGYLQHAYLAAPRSVKLDGVLRQLAELGVRHIHLMECARSVAKPDKSSRHAAILREGCKQSGNPFLPELHALVRFRDAVEEAVAECERVFYGEVAGADAAEGELFRARVTGFFIGPEGGFTPEESALLRERGAVGVHLGPYVLRLETAAVAMSAVLRMRHDL